MLIVLIFVTLINALISAGLALAGLFFPGFIVRDGEGSHTAKVFALYGIARSIPLLLVVFWAAFRADGTALIWLGTLAGIIQLADAAIGLQNGNRLTLWGPLGLAIVQLMVVGLTMWFV
jgi:hypothetical protein